LSIAVPRRDSEKSISYLIVIYYQDRDYKVPAPCSYPKSRIIVSELEAIKLRTAPVLACLTINRDLSKHADRFDQTETLSLDL
jgi:hypothetical protein